MDLSHNCSLHGGMSEVCEKTYFLKIINLLCFSCGIDSCGKTNPIRKTVENAHNLMISAGQIHNLDDV